MLFDDRPKGCNFIKKETLAKMFPVNFVKFLGTTNKTHIRATVFRLSFVNPRKKPVKELI